MPSADAEYKVCYKYPFVSSEILSLNTPFIFDYFFEDIENLDSNEIESDLSDSDSSE